MARRKPDIDNHRKALPKKTHSAMEAMRRQRAVAGAPSAFYMTQDVYWETLWALSRSGFDVARGFVFGGVPVKPYAS